MNSKDLAIGVLSTTAVIMLVGILIIDHSSAPAHASGMTSSGGDYILVTGELWEQEELLYVIDTAQNRLLTYKSNKSTGEIERASGEELSKYLTSGAPVTPAKPGRRP